MPSAAPSGRCARGARRRHEAARRPHRGETAGLDAIDGIAVGDGGDAQDESIADGIGGPRCVPGADRAPFDEAGRDEIGVRVGKLVNQYKVAKHFELAIGSTSFTFARKLQGIAAEATLDGLYIIRTSVAAEQMDAADCVRNYKALANVERSFRSLKTIDGVR